MRSTAHQLRLCLLAMLRPQPLSTSAVGGHAQQGEQGSLSKIRPLPYLSPPLGLSERGGAPWRQEAARDRGAWLAGLSQAAGYNLSEGSASRSMR